YIVAAGLLVGLFAGFYRRGTSGICVATFVGALVCLLLTAAGVIWLSLLALLVWAIVCRLARVRPVRYVVTSPLALAVAFGLVMSEVYRSQQHTLEVLAEYPAVSMNQRLDYEVGRAPSTAAPGAADKDASESAVASAPALQFEIEVDSARQNWPGYRRESSLQSLARTHGNFVDEFVRSQGL